MPGKKVPGKPKRRTTAYTYFYQECRKLLKDRQIQGVVYAEFSKSCAEKLRVMSAQEKRPFQIQAVVDKERFEYEMRRYAPKDSSGRNKGGKKKQSKDPNAPKRPLSAFFWFSNEERPKLRSMNLKCTAAMISKELGRMWTRVDPKDKERYNLMCARDKQRYRREMEGYMKDMKTNGEAAPMQQQQKKYDAKESEQGSDEDDDEIRIYAPKDSSGRNKCGKKKQSKDPNAPKRPLSAFFWFSNDERPKVRSMNPDYNAGRVAKELGRMWAGVDPKDKERYNLMSARDKQRYRREMEGYMKDMKTSGEAAPMQQQQKKYDAKESEQESDEDDEEIMTCAPKDSHVRKKVGKKKQSKDPNAPKRPLTAFFWFCQNERPKTKSMNPEYTFSELGKELGRMWAKVDTQVKDEYNLMAAIDKQRYQREMEGCTNNLHTNGGAATMQQQQHDVVDLTVEESDADDNE